MEYFHSFSGTGQIDKAELDIEIRHDRDRLTFDRKKRTVEHNIPVKLLKYVPLMTVWVCRMNGMSLHRAF